MVVVVVMPRRYFGGPAKSLRLPPRLWWGYPYRAPIHSLQCMASKRRRWAWAIGSLAVVVAAGAVTFVLLRDPMRIPGPHRVQVYALDEKLSGEVDKPPGWFGRVIGMCDADTHYAEDGDRRLCLVLTGPLGKVDASRRAGRITLGAAAVATLSDLAAKNSAATRLVLLAGKPAALVPVTDLAAGTPLNLPALN
jgi:hypothetical protein